MKKDIQHFADGVRSSGQDPDDIYSRGLQGAEGLVAVVDVLDWRGDRSGTPDTVSQ